MRPDQYERVVALYFEDKGFETELSPYTNDYGVDVFARKGPTRVAIQAKMYGGTSRKINRQMIMELHGAKDYFDCDCAVIATNGDVIDNALDVARKLKIEIIHVPAEHDAERPPEPQPEDSFESIWERHVMPLEGKTLYRNTGGSNKIVKVDWSGVERVTSNGKKQKIKIEIFRWTVNHLLENGWITRTEINEEYKERASSGVVLILSNTPLFELMEKPTGLRLKTKKDVLSDILALTSLR